MLQRTTIESLQQVQQYSPPEEVLRLFPSDRISGELGLNILLQNGLREEAVELLAHALVPRVGIWWALLCQRMVGGDIMKAPHTTRERIGEDVSRLIDCLRNTSDIDKMIEEQRKGTEQEKRKWEETLKKEGLRNPIGELSKKLQDYADAMEDFFSQMGWDSASVPVEKKPALEQLRKTMLEEMGKAVNYHASTWTSPKDYKLPPHLEHLTADRIFDAIRQKTEAVKPAIDREMAKYFPLKLRGLPPKASQAKKDAAAAAALRWLLAPTDDNGRLACEAAIEAQSGPESMLAYAAFWSSTNLKTETGLAPTNPALPPMGISKTLLQLALMEGGEMDYDARYEEFLRIGIECADGTSTWDEHGNEVRTEEKPASSVPRDDVFGRRSGFGRD